MKRLIILLGLAMCLSVAGAVDRSYFIQDLGQVTVASPTSDVVDVRGLINHTFQYNVNEISVNVVMRAEGTVDGLKWYSISDVPESTTISASDLSSDSAYIERATNRSLSLIRVILESASGGTPSVDVKYMGNN